MHLEAEGTQLRKAESKAQQKAVVEKAPFESRFLTGVESQFDTNDEILENRMLPGQVGSVRLGKDLAVQVEAQIDSNDEISDDPATAPLLEKRRNPDGTPHFGDLHIVVAEGPRIDGPR